MLLDHEAEVLDKIKAEEAISLAQKMVKIDSQNPPGNEKELADFMSSLLQAIGLEIHEYDFKPNRPNVVSILKPEGVSKTLIFNGHLDTVPFGNLSDWSIPPLSGLIKDGKLFGRGSTDMKSSIAAFVCALKTILEDKTDISGGVLIALTSDEEDSCRGAEDILNRGFRGTAAIVGEPTSLQINIAHKGFARFNLTTYGRPAHTSEPERGVNAIFKMSKALTKLEEISREYQRSGRLHPILGTPTLSVGKIRGGVKDNIVPDACEITIDRRLLPGETPSDVEKELNRRLAEISLEDPSVKFRLSLYNAQPPSETSADETIVRLAEGAVHDVVGDTPKIGGMAATTEMSHFVKAGIPTIILGCGDIRMAHVVDENVPVQQIVDLTKIYSLIVLRYLQREP